MRRLSLALLAILTIALPAPVLAAPPAAKASKAAPLTEARAIALVSAKLNQYPKARALSGRIKAVYSFEPAEGGDWLSVMEDRDSHVTRLWSFLLVPDVHEKSGYRIEAYDVLTDGTVPFETFLKENKLK